MNSGSLMLEFLPLCLRPSNSYGAGLHRTGLADYGIELNLREMDEIFNYFGTTLHSVLCLPQTFYMSSRLTSFTSTLLYVCRPRQERCARRV